MRLYKKQRDEMVATFLPFLSNEGKVPFPSAANLEFVSTSDEVDVTVPIPFPDEDKQGMLVSTFDMQEAESLIPSFDEENEEMEIVPQKLEEQLTIPIDKEDSPKTTEMPEKLVEEPIPTLKEVKMEVDLVCVQETSKDVDKMSSCASKVQSTTNSPINTEITDMAIDASDDHSASRIKEEKLIDTMCGPLLCSTVSSEAMMPELNDFESVNLSRIHHLPESTH